MTSESMLNHMNDAKHKDDERIRKEKEATEDARRLQKQKEKKHSKKKELGVTITSKRMLEEKGRAMLEKEKILNEVLRSHRKPSQMPVHAIVENDGVGPNVVSEMIATSQKKLEEGNKMRKELLKSQTDLGKYRKSTTDILFSKMKKN